MRKKYLFASLFLYLTAILLKSFNVFSIIYNILFILSYIFAGHITLKSTIKNFINNRLIDERFLICISTIGAILFNHYVEGVFVMLFYEFSILFQEYIILHSIKDIPSLIDVKLSYSNGFNVDKTNLTTLLTYYYTPSIIFVSILLAFVPPLFLADGSYNTWIYRTVSFLILSCPCTLILSIPISFFYGMSNESNYTIFIKKVSLLKSLVNTTALIIDNSKVILSNLYKSKLSLTNDNVEYESIHSHTPINNLINSYDVIIMINNSLEIIPAIEYTRHTLLVARQNIIFSLSIKIIMLILGAFGLITMGLGIIIDLFVLLLIFINSTIPSPINS